MRKIKKITVCSMLIMCILIGNVFFSTTASAHNGYLTWANDAKLIGGVGSYGDHVRYFWIHSSAAEEESIIDQVRYEWVNTSSILTTSILIRKISTQKSSVFDIYKNQIYPSWQGVLGESFFFDTSNNDMGVPNADYKWTQIILNTSNFNNLPNFTKRGTISHEFGHCMGLAHGASIEDSGLIASQTNIVIKKNGIVAEEYIVALYGDLDCNGIINSPDETMVQRYMLFDYNGKNIAHIIADINWDKTFSVLDYIRMKKVLSGTNSIVQNRLGGVPSRFSAIIDNTPPNIEISVSQDWDTNNTISITTSDTQSGVFIKEHSFEGNNAVISSENTIQVSKNGNYFFTVYDYAGNATTESVIVNHIIDLPVLGGYEKIYNDFTISSKGINIDLTRYYNSMNNNVGIFGKGWLSTYEATCKDYNNDSSLNLKVVTIPGYNPMLFAYENGIYTTGTSRMKLSSISNGTFELETPENIIYTFNASGQLISITDMLDNTVTITLSEYGKIQSITDSVNRRYLFEYGNNGMVSKISDPSGRIFQYQYDSNDMLLNVIDPMLTCTTQYHCNSDGYIAAIYDAFHNTIESVTYSDEVNGRIDGIIDEAGSEYIYSINDTERKITITDVFDKCLKYRGRS